MKKEKNYFKIKTHYFNDPKQFREEELFNLYHTILEFILPRLKRFKEVSCCYPANLDSYEEWAKIIDSMIYFIERSLENGYFYYDAGKKGKRKFVKGRKNLYKYFFHLWY